MSGAKIPINLIRGSDNERCGGIAMVFNIDHIRELRNLGFAGILAGTLPSAAQQNAFLSVPLRLMAEEALWLVENGRAFFIAGSEVVIAAIQTLSLQEMKLAERKLDNFFAEQRAFKQVRHQEKLQQLGLSSEMSRTSESLLESSLFVETPNSSDLIARRVKANQFDCPEIQRALCGQLRRNCKNPGDYYVYKALKCDGYYLSPGARFGGRFIAYPGDPLRYHSHMTVQPALNYQNDPLDLLQVVSGGRLGTGVKKLWVVAGVRAQVEAATEEAVSFFSIEWAGFG
ncbi:LADA_0C05160g1_1 [Lachancea dasiensis]|uniref:tRNA-splicing endonuclease subunit Sen34 n=1 Tax=Lachancea dasiensis TaxID=1072105 RepID=A0A1G4IZ97_9SACH|nr:LADA_0C05160g1_1 [Lachancea dasiensis]